MAEFIQQYLGEFITALVGGGAGWILNSRKKKAESKTLEANAIEAMQRAYDIYVEHNNKKLKDLEIEIQKLHDEVVKVEEHWREKYDGLNKRYNGLKKEFENYKKKQQ